MKQQHMMRAGYIEREHLGQRRWKKGPCMIDDLTRLKALNKETLI